MVWKDTNRRTSCFYWSQFLTNNLLKSPDWKQLVRRLVSKFLGTGSPRDSAIVTTAPPRGGRDEWRASLTGLAELGINSSSVCSWLDDRSQDFESASSGWWSSIPHAAAEEVEMLQNLNPWGFWRLRSCTGRSHQNPHNCVRTGTEDCSAPACSCSSWRRWWWRQWLSKPATQLDNCGLFLGMEKTGNLGRCWCNNGALNWGIPVWENKNSL